MCRRCLRICYILRYAFVIYSDDIFPDWYNMYKCIILLKQFSLSHQSQSWCALQYIFVKFTMALKWYKILKERYMKCGDCIFSLYTTYKSLRKIWPNTMFCWSIHSNIAISKCHIFSVQSYGLLCNILEIRFETYVFFFTYSNTIIEIQFFIPDCVYILHLVQPLKKETKENAGN